MSNISGCDLQLACHQRFVCLYGFLGNFNLLSISCLSLELGSHERKEVVSGDQGLLVNEGVASSLENAVEFVQSSLATHVANVTDYNLGDWGVHSH